MAEGTFLYIKVYNYMRDAIENGTFRPGDRLPAEGDLREQFGVSAITVKKAFSMLSEEGYVRRVPGKGTFVKWKEEDRQPPLVREPVRNPKLIGMVLEHVATPYGLDMLYRIDRLLSERGYKLCVRYSYANREQETEEIEFLLALGVAGLIIMPCHGYHYSTTILRLIIDEFPIVLIDKKLEGIPVPSVRTDNVSATACLVEHLYERGCRRLGVFSMDTAGATSLVERIEGIHIKMEQLGMIEGPCCFVHFEREIEDNHPEAAVVAQLRRYLRESRSELDGLICTEFGIVSSLVAAAEQEGVPLGADGLMVCCVDEDDLAPGGFTFTHVKQDELTIAERAVGMLEERLNNAAVTQEDCLVPALFRQGKTT